MKETPPRTLDQRLAALMLANAIRRLRVTERTLLQQHPLWAVDMLVETPVWLANLRASEFVQWLPTVGAIKAKRWLDHAGISWRRTLGGLTTRQRDALVELVQEHFSEPVVEQRQRDAERVLQHRRNA